ncbi:MAG TPA: hypothetical protein VMF55_12935 [Solirubrobacterales bacterium]|nr:hypothetical protein [Solirubrobacterales bacterium]
MRARPAIALLLATLGLLLPSAAGATEWHGEQPLTEGSAVPVSLGTIYDIEFWAPNRGALITAKGVWAYDGTGWHRYSTVCGGTEGRIAWAGPLDFWTISDQRAGQSRTENFPNLHSISLCHFVDGAVVASYAEPTGLATSYKQMDAAICLGPSNCWFAGERLAGEPNTGAFHLHWDGIALTAYPSLTRWEPELSDPARAVTDLASFEGSLFESVRVDEGKVAGELQEQPYVLHEILDETPPTFTSIFPSKPFAYGPKGSKPYYLDQYRLAAGGTVLWGIAGAENPGSDPAQAIAFTYAGGVLEQLTFQDPEGLLGSEPEVGGIAAIPGTEAAWVGYHPAAEPAAARLVELHADGTVDDAVALPTAAEEIARKGAVSALACAGPEQCWAGTVGGWIFHWGQDLPRDEAPEMHQLVTYRPPDGATPVLPPDSLPVDDSGSEPKGAEEAAKELAPRGGGRPRRPLVIKVKQRLLGKTVLGLTFTLTAKAHVRLIARRRRQVVAKTPAATLAKGPHELRLRLDPRRWPTGFHLEAKPATKR